MTTKIMTRLSCKLLLLIALGLGLTACAIPSPIENTLSGASLVVTQAAAVSTDRGEATLIWNNPTYSTNNSIVSINISYVGYATANATVPTNNSAGHEIINDTNSEYERLRVRGGRDISYTVKDLTTAEFYEFAIALNYRSGDIQKVELGSAKRVNVQEPTPVMGITNLNVNSDTAGEANFNWTNPEYANSTQLEIQSVIITYSGHHYQIGGSAVTNGSITRNAAAFLRKGATVSHVLPGLTQARYYDFSITLAYRGLGNSPSISPDNRTVIVLPVGPPTVSNLTAVSSGIYQATLGWNNPFYPVPIESVNISYSGYGNASSQSAIPDSVSYVVIDVNNPKADTLLANGMADITHILKGLSFATHYEFNVTLNYLGLNEKPYVETGRIELEFLTVAPGAINPEAVVNALNQVTIIWDNPSYHIPIKSVNISYVGYTGAATDSAVVENSAYYKELNTTTLISRGAQDRSDVIMIMPPALAPHYDFNITLTYIDGMSNVSVIPGRFDVTTPILAPTLALPTATSDAAGRATVSWNNPDPAYPVSIESVTISYEGYDVPMDGMSVPEASSSVTHSMTEGNASLLQMGAQTFVINNLDQARYYAFTITLTYRAMVIGPLRETTAARVTIPLPATTPVISTPVAASDAVSAATITWDNPAYPVPIESVAIAYEGFDEPSAGTAVTGSDGEVMLTTNTNAALLTRGMTGLMHPITGLDKARYYQFNVTVTYVGGATSASPNSDRTAITLPTAPAASTPVAVSNAVGDATITWDNPDYLVPIESVSISYTGYNATQDGDIIVQESVEIDTSASGNPNVLMNGMSGISSTLSGLNLATHYEFNITLVYQGGAGASTSANSIRIMITAPTPMPTNPTLQVSAESTAVGNATVTWNNPFDTTQIQSVNISYTGYAAASGGEVIDESFAFFEASTTSNTELFAMGMANRNYNVTGLAFAEYYVFNVTLTYMNMADKLSFSTTPTLITLPSDVPGAINPETVVLIANQANIIWDNPAYHQNISSVNISYVGYADAVTMTPMADSAKYTILSVGGAGGANDSLLINRRIGRTGLKYVQVDLGLASFYEFNINLTYTDGSSSASGSFPMGRLDVRTAETAPTLASPTAAPGAANEATVTWTNPDYPVSIELVTIDYQGYDDPTAGTKVADTSGSVILTATDNADLLQMGTRSYIIPNIPNNAQATHYQFTVTLTYRAMATAPLIMDATDRIEITR